MTEPFDIQRRRDRAASAIAAFAEGHLLGGREQERSRDPEEVIAELLCDLHHLSVGLGLSWAALTERAEGNYSDETQRHVIEITVEGFQVLDTRTNALRADVCSSRQGAQMACDELNAAGESAGAG
jgi:hypothetical protein